MVNNFPRVGLAGIIKRGDDILLGLRKGSHDSGVWSLPGGHLEYFESFEDCVRREIREETGLEVVDIKPAAVTNDFFPLDDKHYVTLFMTSQYIYGEPQLLEPDKCEEWRWFNKDNFPNKLMVPIINLLAGGYRF